MDYLLRLFVLFSVSLVICEGTTSETTELHRLETLPKHVRDKVEIELKKMKTKGKSKETEKNVISAEDLLGHLLPKPCDVSDTECLNKATETFLEKTAAGIADFDVHPLDPLIIPLMDLGGGDVQAYLKNINLKGLKHQKISDFKMDTKAKSVVLTTVANLTINADIVFEVPSTKQTYSGTYTAVASPLGTARYGYSLYNDDKGVEHFLVGPETTTCNTDSEPQVTLSADLEKALSQDEKVKQYRSNSTVLGSKLFCKVVEVAYVTVVHNIRASAKLLPKAAFFTNV